MKKTLTLALIISCISIFFYGCGGGFTSVIDFQDFSLSVGDDEYKVSSYTTIYQDSSYSIIATADTVTLEISSSGQGETPRITQKGTYSVIPSDELLELTNEDQPAFTASLTITSDNKITAYTATSGTVEITEFGAILIGGDFKINMEKFGGGSGLSVEGDFATEVK